MKKTRATKEPTPIIRQAARARIAIFKTAPRDIPLLEIEIAKKAKASKSKYFTGRGIEWRIDLRITTG